MTEFQKERPITGEEVRERLTNGEWLWQKEIVDRIREDTKDRMVVVLDVDGTLRSNLTPSDIQPNAEKIVSWLKDQGFYVVVWTAAVRETLNDNSRMRLIAEKADLVISRENYRIKESNRGVENRGPEDMQEWADSIGTATWISVEQKKKIDKTGKTFKQPLLLFKNSLLIEDGGIYHQCFDFGWEDNWLFARLYKGEGSTFSHLCVETWNLDEENYRARKQIESGYIDRKLDVDLVKKYLLKLGWMKN